MAICGYSRVKKFGFLFQIPRTNIRGQRQEKEIFLPITVENNNKIDNDFLMEDQDFCSDDSVKDPDYDNSKVYHSSSSDSVSTNPVTYQHTKKYTKTRQILRKELNVGGQKVLHNHNNEITVKNIESDLLNFPISQTTISTVDTNTTTLSNIEASNVTEENKEPTFRSSSPEVNKTTPSKQIQIRSEDSLQNKGPAVQSFGAINSSDSSCSSSTSSSSSSSSSSSDTEPENELNDNVTTSHLQLPENSKPHVSNDGKDTTPFTTTQTNSVENYIIDHVSNNKIAAIESSSSPIQDECIISMQEITYNQNNQQSSAVTKIGRKRKANPKQWACTQAKVLRNSGKTYTTKNKKIKPERSIKPACGDKCKLKCTGKITDLQRKELFDGYWAMADLQRQREYILRHISTVTPRYSYKVHESKRGNNNAYYVTVENERIRVCKKYFKATFDISDRPIKTVVEKTKMCGALELDKRGKHDKHHSVDPALKDGIKKHIDSIPKIESHYCRADTSRVYIDGGKTIADLHRDYVSACNSKGLPSANYIMFYNIFTREYNISFFQPKKDQCEDCTSYANASEEEKSELKEKYDQHLKEKNLAREEKDDDKKHTPDNCIVSVYDLQAAMPCPRGDVSNFYYISKLNFYNFTICNLKSKDVCCFVWHEGEAKRGCIEIGTCVLKYMESLKETAKDLDCKLDLIFYSDNCCGQQKNHFIIALYIYAVHKFDFINSISHKFLIKGHTQNEGDSAHSVIERHIQRSLKSGPIYTPDQYSHIIRNAKKTGKAYQVNELTHDDFVDIKSLATAVGKNYSKNVENIVVKMADIKVLKVESDDTENYSYYYKTSYEDDQYKKVIVDKIGKTRNSNNSNITLKNIYKSKITVCEKKKKGLLALIKKNIIPKFYTSFYENI